MYCVKVSLYGSGAHSAAAPDQEASPAPWNRGLSDAHREEWVGKVLGAAIAALAQAIVGDSMGKRRQSGGRVA